MSEAMSSSATPAPEQSATLPSALRPADRGGTSAPARPAAWPWALIGLLVLAAAVRLSTNGLQSFWFDEAYTPVHVIHPSIVTTMETMAHTENSPPLWYVTIWAWTRIFGTGAVAMRLPSAFAGIALVWAMWRIGDELAGRRAAIAAAGIAAVNPLFVWYSQEARTYELFALAMALAVLCFIRADREPTGRRMAAFALTGSLALLCHYFAVFMLVPMALWLMRRRERRRVAIPAVAAIGLVGAALIPLVLSQGGRGTQWIEEWALSSRLEAIPQYFLTGYSGAPLGHGVELLVALPILAGLAYGCWRGLRARERAAALSSLALAVCGVLIPLVLVGIGLVYLGPRNLIGAMVPLTATIAVVVAAERTGRTGMALAALIAVAFLAICIDVDLSPRLQRGDWSGLAAVLSRAPAAPATAAASARPDRNARAIATEHLGSAPLQYYMPAMRNLKPGQTVRVTEIAEVGYRPLRSSAGQPPAPGFRLRARNEVHGLIVYRFLSARPQTFSVHALQADSIALEGTTDVIASPRPPAAGGAKH